MGLLAILLAAIIMAQWFLWFVATSALFAPWGMAFGIVIVAAQICALFLRRSPRGC
jgi:hypothetical protein